MRTSVSFRRVFTTEKPSEVLTTLLRDFQYLSDHQMDDQQTGILRPVFYDKVNDRRVVSHLMCSGINQTLTAEAQLVDQLLALDFDH